MRAKSESRPQRSRKAKLAGNGGRLARNRQAPGNLETPGGVDPQHADETELRAIGHIGNIPEEGDVRFVPKSGHRRRPLEGLSVGVSNESWRAAVVSRAPTRLNFAVLSL
jgi:hypothetical protein